jgi:anti-anti-sigma factor
MKVDVRTHGSVAVVTPEGPLTRDEVEDFGRALRGASAERQGRVVLDLEAVPYVDSAGLETLLELCGGDDPLVTPRVCGLTETCREALAITRVLERLNVFDTAENAVRSFKR